MFYNAKSKLRPNNRGIERIGMAVSNDMRHWKRFGDQPVIDNGAGITGDAQIVRIGDLWGKTYADNEEGVSAAVAMTEKGDALLHECGCTLVDHPFEVVAEGQMKTAPTPPSYAAKVWENLKDPAIPLSGAAKYPLAEARRRKLTRRINKLLRLAKIKMQIK